MESFLVGLMAFQGNKKPCLGFGEQGLREKRVDEFFFYFDVNSPSKGCSIPFTLPDFRRNSG